jgi:acyl-CoA synthetase (AMP-forming)/AMP-acid ligase II
MDFPQFDEYDLSSMALKYCTSAPFSAELKAEVVRRMPGALIEIYSMTEGGVVCLLRADTNPDKLHTVGIPWAGSQVFTIDEQLNRLPAGEIGELVGRSTTMMSGYQNQPEKTEEASWYDDNGERWQRMGDIGRVDEEGFVTLLGRSKGHDYFWRFQHLPAGSGGCAPESNPKWSMPAVIGIPSRSGARHLWALWLRRAVRRWIFLQSALAPMPSWVKPSASRRSSSSMSYRGVILARSSKPR